jgi:hypothetical protein
MPRHWYNIMADLPVPPAPPLHPGTLQPVGPDDLAPLFPMELIAQEVSTEREIEIPSRCARSSSCGARRRWCARTGWRRRWARRRRSTTSTKASRRRQPQAQHRRAAGLVQRAGRHPKLTTETGAGQWGSSLAFAGSLFGIEVTVFQVRVSYDQKPYRRALMETYGATCIASPSNLTNSGRAILAQARPPGLAGHRHQRGGGDRRHARRHQVRARLGAQPRADAPDHHRPGGDAAAGDGRRRPRRHRRLHRRRQQLRRHRLPLHRPAAARRARPSSGASSPSSPPPAPA